MSFNFNTALTKAELIKPCPKNAEAFEFLSRARTLSEEITALKLELLDLDHTIWLLSPKEERVGDLPNKAVEAAKIIDAKTKEWKQVLINALKRFGETATANAVFLVGEPEYPAVTE